MLNITPQRVTFMAVFVSTLALAQPVHAQQTGYLSVDEYLNRPIEHWSGPYFGIDLSALGAASRIKRGPGVKKYHKGQGSLAAGIHFGYNFSPFGSSKDSGWMLGTEFALTFADLKNSKVDAVLGTIKTNGNFLGSTKLRAGYAWEKVFVYGSAGLGFSDFNTRPIGLKSTDINVGVTYGLGVEFAMSQNWSLRLEGNLYEFGGRSYHFNGIKRKVDQGIAQIKFGGSYRF